MPAFFFFSLPLSLFSSFFLSPTNFPKRLKQRLLKIIKSVSRRHCLEKKSRVADKPRRGRVERGNKSNFLPPPPFAFSNDFEEGGRGSGGTPLTGMHDLRQSDVSLLEGLTRVRHLPNFITGLPELPLLPLSPSLVARINLTVIWKCGAPGWAVREDPVGHGGRQNKECGCGQLGLDPFHEPV